MKWWALLALSVCCWGQINNGGQQIGAGVNNPSGGGGGGSSNQSLAQSVALSNTTTGTAYALTVASTTSGNLAVVIQEDADNPAVSTTPPAFNGGGCAFTNDGSFPNGGAGRVTFWSCPNIPAGKTTVTVTPTSGHSSANYREYSGSVTVSPLHQISAALSTLSAVTYLVTDPPLLTTVNTVAIAACGTGQSATANASAADAWANFKDFPQPNDITDWFAADIVNAFPSQVFSKFNADAHNYVCAVATYKSAVAGAPAGTEPFMYADFSGAASGTTVTVANGQASTRGNPLTTLSASPLTGGTLATACAIGGTGAVYVNGTKYNAAAQGYAYDNSVANKVWQFNGINWTGSESFGVWVKIPDPSDTVDPFTKFGLIAGSGPDFALFFIQNGQWGIESGNGVDSSLQAFSGQYGLKTWVTGIRVPGGTNRMRIYNSAGTQIGSEATVAAFNSVVTTLWVAGRSGAEPGNPSTTDCYSDLLIYTDGTFPVLPRL